MRIMFMGTPDFARVMLEALTDAGQEVAAVVTQPDKPKGRGYTLLPPPVKVCALEKGLPVYQPTTLKGEDFDRLLRDIAPEGIVVVAYGKILPQSVLEYPKYGCINVHGSLLPAYRGAAPIQRALLDDVPETGITIMKMDAGLDTGDMIAKAVVPITDEDDFGTLHDKMAEAGAALLVKTLASLEDGTAVMTPQPAESSTDYAAKIEKEDTKLDFTQSARQVFSRIRALSPAPLATAMLKGQPLKLAAASVTDDTAVHTEPGSVSLTAQGFTVQCGTGSILVTAVLPAGKGRMSAADFVRGRKIAEGDRLEPLA